LHKKTFTLCHLTVYFVTGHRDNIQYQSIAHQLYIFQGSKTSACALNLSSASEHLVKTEKGPGARMDGQRGRGYGEGTLHTAGGGGGEGAELSTGGGQ
jgi:hypothetical protein